jgi:ribosomal protein L40E
MYWGLLSWLVFGVVSAFVARSRGRGGCAWFALGVLLGPIGLILAFTANPRVEAAERAAAEAKAKKASALSKKCPSCGEFNREDAVSCRSCGGSMTAPARVTAPRVPLVGQWTCPRCGAANAEKSPRCTNCGYSADD